MPVERYLSETVYNSSRFISFSGFAVHHYHQRLRSSLSRETLLITTTSDILFIGLCSASETTLLYSSSASRHRHLSFTAVVHRKSSSSGVGEWILLFMFIQVQPSYPHSPVRIVFHYICLLEIVSLNFSISSHVYYLINVAWSL